MIGIARAADDRQVGIFLAQQPRHPQLLDRVVHRQHDRIGGFDPQLVEAARARNVGKADDEAVAPRRRHRVDVGVDRDIGPMMFAQQFGNGAPDAAEPDDDGAALGGLVGPRPLAAHFDPPRDVVADPRQQWRDGQPDRGDQLPEFGGIAADDLRLQRRRQHDQRRFGRACHQQADLGRGAAPCHPRKPQQRRGDDRLDRDDADDRDDQLRPLLGDRLEVEPHADADQEHPQRQAFEGRGDRLDLAMIFGFGDHQPGQQRADDRRQADCGGRHRGGDDDQQTGGQEQFGILGARRLGKDTRQQEPAGHRQHRDDHGALPQGREQHLGVVRRRVGGQRAEDEDDRDDRQILEQQHRPATARPTAVCGCRRSAARARSRRGPGRCPSASERRGSNNRRPATARC